jgi:hypothetical protein
MLAAGSCQGASLATPPAAAAAAQVQAPTPSPATGYPITTASLVY